MLFLIIFGALTLIGVIAIYLVNRHCWRSGVFIPTIMFTLLFGYLVISFATYAICNTAGANYQYKKDYIRYEQLNSHKDSEYLISDIVEYNQQVLEAQKYHDSPWIGIFYYTGQETLPIIETE